MKALAVLGLLAFCAVNVHADNFTGRWRGDGFFVNADDSEPHKTPIQLTIKQTDTSLDMEECWRELREDGELHDACITSSYPLQNDGEIMNHGTKIGDIFPFNIITYSSNDQVSEQISVQKIKDGVVHYRYSYTNLDGASTIRDAILTLQN